MSIISLTGPILTVDWGGEWWLWLLDITVFNWPVLVIAEVYGQDGHMQTLGSVQKITFSLGS